MAEKVIFEFRADRDERSCGFEFRHDMDDWPFGPSILACCEVIGVAGMPHICPVLANTKVGLMGGHVGGVPLLDPLVSTLARGCG